MYYHLNVLLILPSRLLLWFSDIGTHTFVARKKIRERNFFNAFFWELKSVTAFANRSTVLYKETLHHNVSNVRNQKNSTTDQQYWVMSQSKCTLPDQNWPPSTASKSCRKSLCRPRPQECTSMHCSNAKYTGTILLSFLRPGRQDEPNKYSVRWKVNSNNYDTPTRGKVKASKGNGTYIRVGAPCLLPGNTQQHKHGPLGESGRARILQIVFANHSSS